MVENQKHYVGEIGTAIIVNCGEDISTASIHNLRVKKPDGTEVIWNASVYNTNYLKYLIVTGDLDQAGNYEIQAYIEMGGWKGWGETAFFMVSNKYE